MNITGKDFLLYLPAVNAFVVVEAVVHRKANALFIKRKTAAAKKKEDLFAYYLDVLFQRQVGIGTPKLVPCSCSLANMFHKG